MANTTKAHYTFNDYTWTPSNCTSPISYSATLLDGSALPSYLTLTASNRTFNVYTNNVILDTVLTVKVLATFTNLHYINGTVVTMDFTWSLTI